jgi:hypothetical protein
VPYNCRDGPTTICGLAKNEPAKSNSILACQSKRPQDRQLGARHSARFEQAHNQLSLDFHHPGSCTPTSVVRATTIRRDQLAQTSDPRPDSRPWPAWPRPSSKSRPAARPTASAITNGWGSCLIAKPHGDRNAPRGAAARRQIAPTGLRRRLRLSKSPRSHRALFQKLVEGEWINAHDNLALIGPTGVGKSWLASALGHKACRDNRSVPNQRVPRLFEALALARGDGCHPRLLRNLGRADLLILDD